jgi:hypothetical protein
MTNKKIVCDYLYHTLFCSLPILRHMFHLAFAQRTYCIQIVAFSYVGPFFETFGSETMSTTCN